MKTYTVIRRNEPFSWEQVPAVKMDSLLMPTESDVTAEARLCYDDNALYVHLSAVEKNIRAQHFGPLDEICEDSCLEFFLAPVWGDNRYFNIECNPNGAIYLGFGSHIGNLVRLIGESPVIIPKPERKADGWEVTYTVPLSFLRQFFPDFSMKSGTKMRGNFYKCGDLTEIPHYFCWNPMPLLPRASFHNPDSFGTLILE